MTTEQKQDRAEKTRAIIKQVAKMPKAEREALAIKYGTHTPEGHGLSPFNCVFLAYQGAVTAIVGGFRQWQKAGRIVRKGEHACGVIYVPMGQKHKEEDGTETTEEVKPHFRLVPVFAVEQTEEIQQVAVA